MIPKQQALEWAKEASAEGETWEEVSRCLATIAYNQGIEDAAKACESMWYDTNREGSAEGYEYGCAIAIRELKK